MAKSGVPLGLARSYLCLRSTYSQLLLTDHSCASRCVFVCVCGFSRPCLSPGAWLLSLGGDSARCSLDRARGNTESNVEAKRGVSSSLQGVHNNRDSSLPRVALSFSLLQSLLHVIGLNWICIKRCAMMYLMFSTWTTCFLKAPTTVEMLGQQLEAGMLGC